ncbi:uncharacterized protein LOC135949851 [Calliphora vicina]|uniref:uncharacterized protein LOC135949851 n=1 Tax=Calliphora vicina TaxID=7373 RepID=UPI00325ACBE9
MSKPHEFFFTPKLSKSEINQQTPKRKINEISPEKTATQNEVGKMSTSELIDLMAKIFDDKLKNMPTKNDILEVKENIMEVKSEVRKLADENKVLEDEIKNLKKEREEDQKRMRRLEEALGRKKLIIKGLEAQKSCYSAVKNMFKDDLKLSTKVEIEQTKKIFERNNKMTVMVELKSVEMVMEIFKHVKNLKGKPIYIERDLCLERQTDKKIMLQLKQCLLKADKNKKVTVKDDKLVVDEKRFFWNKNKILMSGQNTGEEVLRQLYGEKVRDLNFNYKAFFETINPKN